ncbi:MAG: hypothetical protein C1943_16980 [Halochromatium sp.]|nr:hypothetical protein [Halochromatium sp.]
MNHPFAEKIKLQVLFRTLISLVIISVVLTLAIGVPLYLDLKEKGSQEVDFTIATKAAAINQFVARLVTVAEQVTSRTQIRNKLAEFNAGQVSKQDLIAFTKPKLLDAVQKADDVLGITRLDENGEVAVSVGLPLPDRWLKAFDKHQLSPRVYEPITLDGQEIIMVASPIIDRDQHALGDDIVLFDAQHLRALAQDASDLGQTAELLLLYPDAQALRPLFQDRGDLDTDGCLKHLSDDVLAGRFSNHQLAHPACADCVIAIRPIDQTRWVLIFRVDRAELNAILNRTLERLFLMAVLILIAGLIGNYLLTSPLLRRLHDELNTRQRMVDELERSSSELRESKAALEEDIEQRKRLEKRLYQEHETLERESGFLKGLIQALPDLIWLKDPDGIYLACNSEFEQFFCAQESEIIGKTDYDFVAREVGDLFRKHDKKAMAAGGPTVNEEWVSYARDGRRVLLETTKTPMLDAQGRIMGVLGIGHDITKRKRTEQAILEISQRYEAVLASTLDGFWLTDAQGKILEVNDAYCRYSGYSRHELLHLNIWDLDVMDPSEDVKRRIEKIVREGGDIFEAQHRRKDGSQWPVEVSVSYAPLQGGRLFSFVRDISDRYRETRLAELRHALSEMVYKDDQQRLLQAALDTAEEITGSEIGFFHFVEQDQETLSLQAWSKKTLATMCYAEGKGLHYPISQAGVWVDCIHQRAPVIHNDYAALPHKKGMPDGHAQLVRELTVPVFRDEQIVAVIGVGNKPVDYDDRDIACISRLADMSFDFVERKRAEDQIQFMAYNDLLTGLPNRQLLADRLTQHIHRSRRSHQRLAVCYMDLDNFKPINERYGHKLGDLLLVAIASRLQSDLREGDTLARIGGDEFVVLFTELGSIYQSQKMTRRLLELVVQPFDIKGHRVHVSASVGVTIFPEDDADPDTLLRHADQAMHRAKAGGKNTCRLFDPIQQQTVHDQQKALEDFDQALDQGQLRLYYQPRIDLHTGVLASVEALARWQHPERGLLPPGDFLPVIDGTSLEIALDEWVIHTALNQHMRWREQGLLLPVSVNISPRHIQQQSFPDFLARRLSEYPTDVARHLELEVLETSSIDDTARVSEVMNACTKLGVHFSLDDFGTGYSSLTYFHRLPINILKIDQHFVRNMLTDPGDQNIVEGVLRLADALKRPVVAEGVESFEIGFMLMQLGCRYAQGYGIAKPMPAERVADWAAEWTTNSLWRDLQHQIQGLTPYYDLNVAVYAHRYWLTQFKAFLASGLTTECPMLDAGACQFERWYQGIGLFRYGMRSRYAFIQAKHMAVHALAAEIVNLAEHQGLEKARARLDELDALAEALTAQLLQLGEA